MNTAPKTLNKRLAAALAGLMAVAAIGSSSLAHAQAATSTASTTSSSAAVISGIGFTEDASGNLVINWTTDIPATSQVYYAPLGVGYNQSTPFDPSLVTFHSVAISGLTRGDLYHMAISSTNADGVGSNSPDRAFAILNTDQTGGDMTGTVASSTTATSTDTTSTTTTATSTDNTTGNTNSTSTNATSTADVSYFQQRIAFLENLVAQLRQRIADLESTLGNSTNNGNNNGNGTTTTTGSMMWSLTPVNGSVRAGTSIDFNGRNFPADQTFTVTSGGARVGTAFADDGGNFTTGSIPVSSTPGTQTFTFTGAGMSIERTVTVTQ